MKKKFYKVIFAVRATIHEEIVKAGSSEEAVKLTKKVIVELAQDLNWDLSSVRICSTKAL